MAALDSGSGTIQDARDRFARCEGTALVDVKQLHTKIGELTMEDEFFGVAPTKAGCWAGA